MTINGLDVKFATSLDFLAAHGNKLMRLQNFIDWLKKELDHNEFLLRELGTIDEFFNIEVEIVYRGISSPVMRLNTLFNTLSSCYTQQIAYVDIAAVGLQGKTYVLRIRTVS